MESLFFSANFANTLFIIFCISSSSYINPISASSRPVAMQTNIEFIKTSCSTTTYPKLCFTSLSVHASAIQNSSKLLATTALSIMLSLARSTSTKMMKLSQTHGLKPREVAAMHDCLEVLSDSVDELEKSISEMKRYEGGDKGMMINDVQTRVSAALTDQTTRSDGFEENGMNGNLKNVVRG